jgi:hypothetical protein
LPDCLQVISNLGIFNSRVHLVSMAEAVKGDPEEEPKFRAQIPSIAQVRAWLVWLVWLVGWLVG